MKKVVAVLGCDYHLHVNNSGIVRSIWNQHISLCKEHGCCAIVGGDMFTDRSGQPLSVLTAFKDMIQHAAFSKVKVEMIPGNHDKTDADSERSYLDVYDSPYLTVHSRGKARIIGGVVFGMMPYFGNESWLENFGELSETVHDMCVEGDISEDTAMVLITHMGVEGVRNNDGSLVSSPIKPDTFDGWDKVLIGHYHDASQLGDNIFYVGSVYQNNYGENITDKGFTLIYDDGSTKFKPSIFPKYIKEVVDINDKESLRNIIDKHGCPEEDYVRIVFKGKKEDLQNINKAELSQQGFDVQFIADEQRQAMESAESEDVLEYDKGTIMKDFMLYCKDNNIRGEQFKFGVNLVKGM